MKKCIFCDICNGVADSSIIYQDENVIAFMSIHPVNPGEVILATKSHIERVEDLDDELLTILAIRAKEISKVLRQGYKPISVGWVVHGFMVHHAHIILIPQHTEHDITSSRWIKIRDGIVVFDETDALFESRSELDKQASFIKNLLHS